MTGADDHLVVFTPSGLRGSFAAGTTLLDAARRLGVDLDSVCGGRGICGRYYSRGADALIYFFNNVIRHKRIFKKVSQSVCIKQEYVFKQLL